MMESMPTSFPDTILDKHHHGSDFRKRGFYTLGALFDCAIACRISLTKQEYFLLMEVSLNEYRNDLVIVSYRQDFLSFAVPC